MLRISKVLCLFLSFFAYFTIAIGKGLTKLWFGQIQPSQNDMHKISFGSSLCWEKIECF